MTEQDDLVVGLAQRFLKHLREAEPDFQRAFYRFDAEPGSFGGKASVVSPKGVALVSSTRNAELLRALANTGNDLIRSLGKDRGVFLLTVDSNYDYNIQFEWDDLRRWQISMLNGGTGIPDGI
jgi:hypothetical protein